MENNKITNNEDIHVKVDQNNLIYIDPNSSIDSQGNISPRNIKAEKLVMYVNLEADIVPRSILSSDNQTNTLTSIAKGTLNFLKNGDGQDYDTSWTNSFLNSQEKKNSSGKETGEFFQADKSGQTFGIDNISIAIKGFNAIPTINITFLDVRGKTLFESPEDSPYKAFFHIPWPIFYLTVKGFYGKAIKYRLHLVKFTSKFNESNGNFEVNTSFVGSTYAWLSDIPLQGILTAPYLFPNESKSVTGSNTSNGKEKETVKKSSRGYEMLKTVYNEYKLKGLIPKDFPVKTLKEVITISTNLDMLLERQIFDQVVDMRIFAGLKQFEEDLNNFEEGINGWAKRYLETVPNSSLSVPNPADPRNPILYFNVNRNPRFSREDIDGDEEGKLQRLLKVNTEKIRNSQLLTDNLTENQPKLINSTTGIFSINELGVSKIKDYKEYVKFDEISLGVSVQSIIDDLNEIRKKFEEQRSKLQKDVEKQMNVIIKNKKNGFGFDPTIRNIFAVILSNAEVLIRLMKDVHKKAFEQADTRKKIVGQFSNESTGDSIYPWPELKATVLGKENTIIYPGDPEFQTSLDSGNAQRWPEVAFLESYIGITTNKVDPLAEKEGSINKIPNMTQNDVDVKRIKKISNGSSVINILPYVNKNVDSFLYEIFERAFNYTLIDTFNKDTLLKLANLEYNNIFESIRGENTLRKILKINVINKFLLLTQLYKLSPFEKYSYYKDSLPTVDYLKSFYGQSFSIESYTPSNSIDDKLLYEVLDKNLENYVPETYRKYIYPFSSNVYLNYISTEITSMNDTLLNCRNFLNVDTTQSLISGQIDPKFWLKNGLVTNLFSQKFSIGNTKTNILNTPFFHRQLFSDFNVVGKSNGKYVGSAYLLLNSLAFRELDEIKLGVNNTNSKVYSVLPSSIFKEINSSQYIPYHLMLKWGAIYHRHKKYILEKDEFGNPYDIIGDKFYQNGNLSIEGAVKKGTTTSGNNIVISGFTTNKIDGETFFDNGIGLTFQTDTSGSSYVTYNTVDIQLDPNDIESIITLQGQIDVGIHPYYDNIFYNVVNGTSYFDFVTGNTHSYYDSVTGGTLNLSNNSIPYSGGTLYYWTQYVDDSKVKPSLTTFTLLPSSGGNLFIGSKQSTTKVNEKEFSNNSFTVEEQNNFRIVWDDDLIGCDFTYTGHTFASPIEHSKNLLGTYGIDNNYKMVMDLMATFSPTILDEFEKYFLLFSSEKLNVAASDKPFGGIVYDKFQDLLKEIVSLKKDDTTTNQSTQISNLKTKQNKKLEEISNLILSNNNLIKITIGNSKEIDPHSLIGFIDKDPNNTFTYDTYKGDFDINLSNLYLGPEPIAGCYKSFFEDNNVDFNEENLQIFRPIIFMYAGYKDSSYRTSIPNFKNYLNEMIFTEPKGGANYRLNTFLQELTRRFTEFEIEEDETKITFFDGYNNKALKVELYNFFKSMNDKWIAGNSIGQRSLLEEFLFLDRANKDIGNDYYFDISRLTSMGDSKNLKQSLYGAISILLQSTGFDMRALPAYVNFYGTNFSNTPKLTPSKKIAQNLFGTFLDVDYQESSPKIIIQYVGKSSTRPDMGKDNKKYKFTDDSFNVGNVNNNPLLITLPKVFQTGDLIKSNKVVAFEVSFGDQNQSIFKGVTLDQATIKNTSESFYVLENLARSESGSGAHNVDIGLYDYYRQAAYSCDVSCMGNVMIQPTMYFYLKNIPMFKGTYWISEVTHTIKNGVMNTTFKGSRIPYASLPDLSDSFMSSYRTLFGKLQEKAINRINGSDRVTETSKVIKTLNGEIYTFDPGITSNENFTNEAGYSEAGVPFNGKDGSRYISQIKIGENTTWLRARAVTMGEEKYPLYDDNVMSVVASNNDIVKSPSFTWMAAAKEKEKSYFFATKFTFNEKSASSICKLDATFNNPSKNITITVTPKYELDTRVKPIKFSGPIDIIKDIEPYGIALSSKLMRDLNLHDGDIVYFNIG
jgi:hypothetical protein